MKEGRRKGEKVGTKNKLKYHSPEHKVEGRLLLDVVVREGAAILKLLAGEDQALLVGGNTGAPGQYQSSSSGNIIGLTLPCPESWP